MTPKREAEIKRLVNYAKGLGVKQVIFTDKMEDSGGWVLDGSTIYIRKDHKTSSHELILALIHELGHALYFIWVKNRNPDIKYEEAIERQNIFEEEFSDEPLPKSLRKKIYDVEVESAKFWDIIYKDTDIQIPKVKLDIERECDIWIYHYFYIHGKFPTRKLKLQNRRKVKEKYRKRGHSNV